MPRVKPDEEAEKLVTLRVLAPGGIDEAGAFHAHGATLTTTAARAAALGALVEAVTA